MTTKELTGISEQLSAEKSLIAKYDRLSQETQDQNLSTKFKEISQKHQNHYDTLFAFLR